MCATAFSPSRWCSRARDHRDFATSVVDRAGNRKKFLRAAEGARSTSLAPESVAVETVEDQSTCAGGSAGGGAHRVQELVARERLVEERRPGVTERRVRFLADGTGRDEDESMTDGAAAGRDLAQEVEPVDTIEIEVGDHEVDAIAELLASLIGAGHGERRAARRLEVLEQDLLHRLIVLHDEDPHPVETKSPTAGLGERAAGGGAHGQVDRKRGAPARPTVRRDLTSVFADDPVGDAESEPGAGRALGRDERVEDLR